MFKRRSFVIGESIIFIVGNKPYRTSVFNGAVFGIFAAITVFDGFCLTGIIGLFGCIPFPIILLFRFLYTDSLIRDNQVFGFFIFLICAGFSKYHFEQAFFRRRFFFF